MKPERIALITNFLPPYRMSALSELRDRFARLSIFISTRTDLARSWAPEWGDLSVAVQHSLVLNTKWTHPHGFTEPMTLQIPYDTIPRLIRLRPDVIVAAEMGARTVQAAIYCTLFRRARLVIWATVSEITEQGRAPWRIFVRRLLLRAADAVIVNGESGARYIRTLGVNDDRIFRAAQTTAIDHFRIPEERHESVRHRLLYSGRLAAGKGLKQFLSGLTGWCEYNPERQIEFWLVGDGPMRQDLSAQRGPPNLRVRFLGHVSYERLPEIYAQGGIFAFPTLADEWGMAVVEAMAAGLPVLGSIYSQAVEELVIDGANGWTFCPDDPSSMRNAIDRSLSTPAKELEHMSDRAVRDTRKLTPAAMADSIADAITYAFANHS